MDSSRDTLTRSDAATSTGTGTGTGASVPARGRLARRGAAGVALVLLIAGAGFAAQQFLGRGEQQSHPFLYWEFHEGGSKQAVRMGDWKAVRPRFGGPTELYDLKADVGEQNSVAAKHPDVVARIEGLVAARTP